MCVYEVKDNHFPGEKTKKEGPQGPTFSLGKPTFLEFCVRGIFWLQLLPTWGYVWVPSEK
jgi:hypothetical protein